jgi:cell wall-associated NlpC family hydrolase
MFRIRHTGSTTGRTSSRTTADRRRTRRTGAVGGVLCGIALITPASAATTADATPPAPSRERVSETRLDVLADGAGQAETIEQALARLGDDIAEREAAAERAAAAKRKARAKAAAERREAAEERAAKAARAAEERASRSSGRPSLPEAPASAGGLRTAIDFALAQVGDAYALGASGPDAWDCSGLTRAAFSRAGVSLPRVASAQAAQAAPIQRSQVRAGDLLFWTNNGAASGVYHVAISLGGDRYVDAGNPGSGVRTADFGFSAPQLFGRVG